MMVSLINVAGLKMHNKLFSSLHTFFQIQKLPCYSKCNNFYTQVANIVSFLHQTDKFFF